MDFLRLTLPGQSNYHENAQIIAGWTSLIWTERYQEPGEFELHTPRILEGLGQLPEKSLVSINQSREVMIVETRTVEVDEDGKRFLKVVGRSADSFLEWRHVEGVYQKKRKMRRKYNAAGAALVLLWNAIDNNSGKDVTRGDPEAENVYKNDYSWNTKDAIANVIVTDSTTGGGGANRHWWLTEGPLYPQLMNILSRGDLGIRVLRPQGGAGTRVSIVTGLANRGDITRTPIAASDAIRFDIYSGSDRSHEQTANKVVGFKYRQGHLENAEYLYSIKDFATAVEVMTTAAIPDQYRNSTQQAYTGWDRRVISHDAGEPEIPDEPEKPAELKKNATKAQREARKEAMDKWIDKHAAWKQKRDRILAEFKEDTIDDVARVLKARKRVALFSGDISPLAPYVYGRDYFLGDAVTLYGEYGEVEKMIVTEYVRTHDAEGDSGYPGLSMP